MPTIKRFRGCRLEMYYGDHPPPHFHITSGSGAVKVAIRGRRLLAGHLPARLIRDAIEWAASHETELMAIWDKLNEPERRP